MVVNLLMGLALQCPVPKGWKALSLTDQAYLYGIHEGCQRHYDERYCAVKVVKAGEMNYRVTCGVRK